MAAPLLDIDRLGISFFTRAAEIPAVMDFSCRIMPGQAMGLVGESGCGKSTVALAIMRDLPGLGRITSGAIRFEGRDMASLTGGGAAPRSAARRSPWSIRSRWPRSIRPCWSAGN